VYRHRFDPSSLVAGVLFLVIGLRYLNDGFGGGAVTYDWAVPATLVTLAVVVVLRRAFRGRRREM
jgi:hypothetical protein